MPVVLADPLTPERKDEIGPMIFEEEISVDTLRFLSVQEIIFLLTTLEIFNKKSPLPGYKENHCDPDLGGFCPVVFLQPE